MNTGERIEYLLKKWAWSKTTNEEKEELQELLDNASMQLEDELRQFRENRLNQL